MVGLVGVSRERALPYVRHWRGTPCLELPTPTRRVPTCKQVLGTGFRLALRWRVKVGRRLYVSCIVPHSSKSMIDLSLYDVLRYNHVLFVSNQDNTDDNMARHRHNTQKTRMDLYGGPCTHLDRGASDNYYI